MNAIILAAGQGTRLRPFTDHVPKCMVEVRGRPILLHQLHTLKKEGIDNIIVVCGYREEKIHSQGIIKVLNPEFATTNMVYSLFCAESNLKPPFILCYGDIIYHPDTLRQIVDDDRDIVIASDRDWYQYWRSRCEDPLNDAESFRKGDKGKVQSLGKIASNVNEIEGQFIGMIRFSRHGWDRMREEYHTCRKNPECAANAWNSGRTLHLAYMTDILNHLAGKGHLHYSEINRGWFEIDNHDDLRIAEQNMWQH
ncbi:MAG TPA: phosphocholine cytidylyltransferase family protein [Saprospiraceae bacterium]|nr:phosphocholine cytidylyltransferase family protein [Saprospiraceae bacterium]